MGIIYIFNKIPKTFFWNFIKYIFNYRLFTFYTKFKQNNACPICFTAAAGTGISQDLKKFKIIIFYLFLLNLQSSSSSLKKYHQIKLNLIVQYSSLLTQGGVRSLFQQ